MLIYYLLIAILFVFVLVLFLTRRLLHLNTGQLIAGMTGIIIGIFLGAILGIPISRLPGEIGEWLPLATTIILGIAFFFLFLAKRRAIYNFFINLLENFITRLSNVYRWRLKNKSEKKEFKKEGQGIIIDTSVIIDGRIENLIKTGFISEKLIIPQFVILELQAIADSNDSLKRKRGRRGLEIIKNLQREKEIKLEISDQDYPKIKKVDSKLIKLAQESNSKILTTDYNLNKVAGISGVKVLNINELANALKIILLPGEEITVKVVQEGKEKGQGVGYLDDGTMLVVEGGINYIGQEVRCEVKRVFQTDAGKIFFLEPTE